MNGYKALSTKPLAPLAGLLKSAAGRLCDSALANAPRSLWLKNQADSHMPLSRVQKALVGLYLATSDWAKGEFPPSFERETAWENERRYADSMTGLTFEQVRMLGNIKPFDYHSNEFEAHARNVSRIRAILRSLKIVPPARILELGCGHGWLSEMIAMMGFQVTGTSISPIEIAEAERRVKAFESRGIPGSLTFDVSPMEEVHGKISDQDCAIVYQALHHAFDWRETVHSVTKVLRPGGWLVICDEPNISHTLVSYRVGKLTHTHEIGISRRQLTRELRNVGFGTVKSFAAPLHFWIRWHWLAAQLTSR